MALTSPNRTKASKSLAQVGLAYQARAKPKAAVTPAIAQLAKDLTVNSNTPEDKVRALHQWVAQNIRYLGIYVGAGGFVPHDAQTILDNRYGDCKDHVTLLEALLTTVGIESSTALINSSAARLLPK
ncbi:MAG: transglutaminase domain-containing protein, partial [Betaproteobacteria bacterium]|nr:transglutaminase domain-containing protein [Betaproteobacteria bacterium]